MNQTINEKIEVVAQFGRDLADIKPYKFKWQDQEFNIQKSSKYRYKNGSEVIYVFSGTDGSAMFQFDFNVADFTWRLRKLWNTVVQ